jgi:ribonucleotide monophosphatase NagD (HAD superfamily)
MIGDNPPVDIKGANDSGFVSVLVRTGVFNEGENDLENPAKYVVNDVNDAVDLILRLEGNSLI